MYIAPAGKGQYSEQSEIFRYAIAVLRIAMAQDFVGSGPDVERRFFPTDTVAADGKAARCEIAAHILTCLWIF